MNKVRKAKRRVLHTRRIVVFVVMGLLTTLSSCGINPKKKFGQAYDEERVARDIPVLGTNAHTMSDWGLFWNYDCPQDFKGRYYKRLEVANGEIVSEMDAYQSGIHFVTAEGGKAYEYLQVVYSYEAEREGKDPWSAIHYFEGGTQELGLVESEALLSRWGLQRISSQ